jgi:hypothetical protein
MWNLKAILTLSNSVNGEVCQFELPVSNVEALHHYATEFIDCEWWQVFESAIIETIERAKLSFDKKNEVVNSYGS